MIFTENELKKWTLKSQKSQITILLLNQCSISAVFLIVRFPGDQKTALTGESLYYVNRKVGCVKKGKVAILLQQCYKRDNNLFLVHLLQ